MSVEFWHVSLIICGYILAGDIFGDPYHKRRELIIKDLVIIALIVSHVLEKGAICNA